MAISPKELNDFDLAQQLGEADEAFKALEKRVDALKRVFKARHSRPGTYAFGDFVFAVSQEPGKRTLDKDSLIEAGVDVEAHMKQGALFMKMSIRRVDNAS